MKRQPITCGICGARCACRNQQGGICCSDHTHKQRIAYEQTKAAAQAEQPEAVEACSTRS